MEKDKIDIKYKWDLTKLYKSDKEFLDALKRVDERLDEFDNFKDKLSDAQTILSCLTLQSDILEEITLAEYYAMLKKDLNGADSDAQRLYYIVCDLNTKIDEKTSFINSQIIKLDEKFLDKLITDASLKDYDYFLKRLKEQKKHVLNENEEMILAQMASFSDAFCNIHSAARDVDIKYGKIKLEDGKLHQLTESLVEEILTRNKDAKIRKKAHQMRLAEYKKLNNTLGTNYINELKKNWAFAKVRNYNSCLESALNEEDVSVKAYETLIAQANKNIGFLHNFYALKSKALGINLEPQDLALPLCDKTDIQLEYEESYSLVIQALQLLGQDYVDKLIEARDNRWIDVYEMENKASGAYSASVLTPHPFVLLNYTKNLSYAHTIAHEMGHALHSVYSNKCQPKQKSDYTSFAAEVASTVNEILLSFHLAKKYKDDLDMQKFIYSDLITNFNSTFFTQAMFSEFEVKTHSMIEKGEGVSVDILNNLYKDLSHKQFGGHVKTTELRKYGWSAISHFYYDFYVYKYATGIIAAINFATKIYKGDKEALEKYKEFLSAGGSKSPVDILRDSGVDMETDKPYDVAFEFMNNTFKKLENIIDAKNTNFSRQNKNVVV